MINNSPEERVAAKIIDWWERRPRPCGRDCTILYHQHSALESDPVAVPESSGPCCVHDTHGTAFNMARVAVCVEGAGEHPAEDTQLTVAATV